MRHTTLVLTGLWLACAVASASRAQPAPAATAAAGEGPTEVVQSAAQGMLGDLDKDRDAYHRDPAKVGQLVDKYLLPHFDTEASARLVLGAHWRTATPEQRRHFIDAFYHSLLTNYGTALVDFTADRLKIFPTKVDPDATRATVRTEVKRANGDRVSVNYYLHKTPQGWKAWDVVIDGISYVNSYRTDFGEQIEAQGIDAVIKRLEAGEKPGAIGKQTVDKGG
ncbi:MAG TPA: ABC transporter substrate-binding protein [Steroidobacteraceae bacterium]|nr:ABC transporter substrate-binding protein [Steroidobacteraceae bacterium]